MLAGDMGRLRTLAQTFRELATTHVEEPDVPVVAGASA